MQNKYVTIISIFLLILLIITRSSATEMGSNELSWSVTKNGKILEISYGSGSSFPQYAALDLTSSYMRLVSGPDSGWGTSIILLPSFWSQTSCQPNPCQGATVTVQWWKKAANLIITVKGIIGGLNVTSKVIFTPPFTNSITAHVKIMTIGKITLDNRVGESFKPIMLSSMHDSSTQWDTQYAYAGKKNFSIPINDWIVYPPISSKKFGLVGGTSSWKVNAPTIEINQNKPRQITGWVAQDDNPNNDNVGYWCATDEVLPSWNYSVTATGLPKFVQHYSDEFWEHWTQSTVYGYSNGRFSSITPEFYIKNNSGPGVANVTVDVNGDNYTQQFMVQGNTRYLLAVEIPIIIGTCGDDTFKVSTVFAGLSGACLSNGGDAYCYTPRRDPLSSYGCWDSYRANGQAILTMTPH